MLTKGHKQQVVWGTTNPALWRVRRCHFIGGLSPALHPNWRAAADGHPKH